MDFRAIKEFIKDSINYLIVIIVVVLIAIYIVSLQQVIGPSMKPTLKEGDILLLDKVTHKIFDIKRNDIIAFYYADTKFLIKRIIGLPGETIYCTNNIIYIDGNPLDDINNLNTVTDDFNLQTFGYDKIPNNMYFVLGDNRENSEDSREFGLIKKEEIIGKTIIRLWPLSGIKIIK